MALRPRFRSWVQLWANTDNFPSVNLNFWSLTVCSHTNIPHDTAVDKYWCLQKEMPWNNIQFFCFFPISDQHNYILLVTHHRLLIRLTSLKTGLYDVDFSFFALHHQTQTIGITHSLNISHTDPIIFYHWQTQTGVDPAYAPFGTQFLLFSCKLSGVKVHSHWTSA